MQSRTRRHGRVVRAGIVAARLAALAPARVHHRVVVRRPFDDHRRQQVVLFAAARQVVQVGPPDVEDCRINRRRGHRLQAGQRIAIDLRDLQRTGRVLVVLRIAQSERRPELLGHVPADLRECRIARGVLLEHARRAGRGDRGAGDALQRRAVERRIGVQQRHQHAVRSVPGSCLETRGPTSRNRRRGCIRACCRSARSAGFRGWSGRTPRP